MSMMFIIGLYYYDERLNEQREREISLKQIKVGILFIHFFLYLNGRTEKKKKSKHSKTTPKTDI